MPVEVRDDLLRLSGGFQLTLTHFALGTFPCDGRSTVSVNRLLLILKNPGGEASGYEDKPGTYQVAKPGWAYLLPAFTPVRVRYDQQLSFVSIHFKLELFQALEVFSAVHSILARSCPEETREAQDLFREEKGDPVAAIKLRSFVSRMAALFLTAAKTDALQLAERFSAYREVIEYIRANCSAKISVAELAGVMRMRRDVFTRKFSAETGISPKAFFHRILLSRAVELLRQPEATVRQVAYQLGFSSEYYFSRFFRKHTGLPPHRYQLQSQYRGSDMV